MPTYTTNFNFIKPNVDDAVDEDLWGGYLNANLDSMDTLFASAGDPIGSGKAWFGTAATVPSGYLLCYGQAVSRTTYSALFTAIGTTYGTGDGVTTFNLPDLRGRVIAGKDDMGGTSANRLTTAGSGLDGDVLGNTGGAETHTLTEAQLAAHFHYTYANEILTVDNGNIDANTTPAFRSSLGGGTNAFNYNMNPSVSLGATVGKGSTTGSGAAHNNVQPTLIANYIIRAL